MNDCVSCETLLLQPPITLKKEDVRSFGFFPPIGLAYLAGVLEESGRQVVIRDLLVEGAEHGEDRGDGNLRVGLPEHEIERILRRASPRIVGISNIFSAFSADSVLLARLVRKVLPDALVVMGGAQAGMEPRPLLKTGAVDVVVIGEGEYVFRDLASAVLKGRLDEARTIEGTVWLGANGDTADNKGRLDAAPDPIPDLDGIPLPAYHLLPMERYIWQRSANFAVAMRRPVGHMITTRGCPFSCIFCSTTKHYKVFRKRSAENVLKEIKFLIYQYGIRELHFHDDSFAADAKRVAALCRMIIDEGLDIRWQVSQGINSCAIDEDLLELMHQSGMYRVGFPIESACAKTLRFIRKPIRLDKVTKLIQKCNELGIYTFGCFMIGFPEETRQEIEETIDFILHSGLDYVKVCITQPLVGSDLYSVYRSLDLMEDDARHGSTYAHTEYDTVHLKSGELNEIRDRVLREFGRRRLRNALTPRGFRRDILPKLKSFEEARYFLKVGRYALFNGASGR
jgi:radical SAM superfamily enzyme YgiQ (UPF0313 family)